MTKILYGGFNKEGKVPTAEMVWAALVSLLIRRVLAVQRQFELKEPVQFVMQKSYKPRTNTG